MTIEMLVRAAVRKLRKEGELTEAKGSKRKQQPKLKDFSFDGRDL